MYTPIAWQAFTIMKRIHLRLQNILTSRTPMIPLLPKLPFLQWKRDYSYLSLWLPTAANTSSSKCISGYFPACCCSWCSPLWRQHILFVQAKFLNETQKDFVRIILRMNLKRRWPLLKLPARCCSSLISRKNRSGLKLCRYYWWADHAFRDRYSACWNCLYRPCCLQLEKGISILRIINEAISSLQPLIEQNPATVETSLSPAVISFMQINTTCCLHLSTWLKTQWNMRPGCYKNHHPYRRARLLRIAITDNGIGIEGRIP